MTQPSDTRSELATARTLLFVPGDRPERFSKAAASGTDLVVLDLEDAVRSEQKETAREHVRRWLAEGNRACVRINGAATSFSDDDLMSLKGLAGLAGVLLPKAEDPRSALEVGESISVPVLAIIETASGVLQAAALAATTGVERLALGALDLALDLWTEDRSTLDRVRTQLVIASRASGLAGPVDSVTTDLTDWEVAGREARTGKILGMGGKLCIHPEQVAPVTVAYEPDQAEIRWARKVLESGVAGGVTVVDSMMVDEPVLARARRVLEQAGEA